MRAYDLRADAAVAERAAYALRMGKGDLRRAVSLGAYAIAAEPNNATFRITLGEVYLAANLVQRAAEESAIALKLVPDDPRAKQLAAAIAKMQQKK